jgi:hypothetical protein
MEDTFNVSENSLKKYMLFRANCKIGWVTEEKKMSWIALLCIKDANSSVSHNSANITTPSSYEVKTETA